jgi:hypothetical protein
MPRVVPVTMDCCAPDLCADDRRWGLWGTTGFRGDGEGGALTRISDLIRKDTRGLASSSSLPWEDTMRR